MIIRIGVKTLAFCFELSEENNPYDENAGDFRRSWKVTDPLQFAKGVIAGLRDEEEDGSTPLTRDNRTMPNSSSSMPTREDLAWVLDGFGIAPNNPDFEAGLVMLAALPCGGDVSKITASTQVSDDRIQKWKAAMIREGVWPGLLSWGNSGDNLEFLSDLFAVTGKLHRFIENGEVKYIAPSKAAN